MLYRYVAQDEADITKKFPQDEKQIAISALADKDAFIVPRDQAADNFLRLVDTTYKTLNLVDSIEMEIVKSAVRFMGEESKEAFKKSKRKADEKDQDILE